MRLSVIVLNEQAMFVGSVLMLFLIFLSVCGILGRFGANHDDYGNFLYFNPINYEI